MTVAVETRPAAHRAPERSRPLSITARGLSKSFGDRLVIDNLHLH